MVECANRSEADNENCVGADEFDGGGVGGKLRENRSARQGSGESRGRDRNISGIGAMRISAGRFGVEASVHGCGGGGGGEAGGGIAGGTAGDRRGAAAGGGAAAQRGAAVFGRAQGGDGEENAVAELWGVRREENFRPGGRGAGLRAPGAAAWNPRVRGFVVAGWGVVRGAEGGVRRAGEFVGVAVLPRAGKRSRGDGAGGGARGRGADVVHEFGGGAGRAWRRVRDCFARGY